MCRHWRVLALCLIVGFVVIAMTDTVGQAADDEKEIKVAREKTLKIADLIAAKDFEGAKKEAGTFAKKLEGWKDVGTAMKTMALRDNNGVGFGEKGKFGPDGIEAKIISLGRKPLSPKDMSEQSADLVKSGNIAAACAEIALAKPPEKKQGKKDPADWKNWAKEMKEAAAEFSDAAAKKDPDALKKASVRLNSSCTDCHAIFKEK